LSQVENPTWFFAPLNGGEESGLNESGIEAFKRSESLGRETCQNILDHPDGSRRPCVAEFEYIDLPAEDFPGRDQFAAIFQACRDHILRMLPSGAGNERRFFETGLELLANGTIPTLRIGDENTTGLVGSDDDRSQPFWRLLKGQGFSSLQGVSGGTYGIGQRAPFARSALRTVLYSTRLGTGAQAFVAKAILASHPSPSDPRRALTQSKGWYCHAPSNGAQQWSAVRNPAIIQPRFRRSIVGTDLYITGYVEQDWEQRIRYAVLQNFFSAIDRGLLEIRLKRNGSLLGEITESNLEEKLVEAADEARQSQPKADHRRGLGATLYYLKALRNSFNGAPFTRLLDDLGTVKMYVHRDIKDPGVPERWVCMRRPMMVVEDHGSGLVSRFAAVIVCDDEPGNLLLAQMEDPRHSRWHEEEARNWSSQEQKRGREARLAIGRFVAETLKQIRDENMPASQDVPFLGRYLPLDTDTQEDCAVGAGIQPTGGAADIETGHRITASSGGVITGRARRSRPAAINLDGNSPQDVKQNAGSVGSETGHPQDSGGGGERDGSNGAGAGRAGYTDATGPGAEGHAEAQPTAITEATPSGLLLTGSDIRFRSYMVDGGYCVILESTKDLEGDVVLRAVGEDSDYPVRIVAARDTADGAAFTTNGARITGVKLLAGQPRRIELQVGDSALPLCLSIGK
jgi:hypothetical protein